MRKLWSLTFFANLMPLSWIYFFFYKYQITLQFKSAEHTRFLLSGEQYVQKVLMIVLGLNFVLYVIFKMARRTNILDILYFPNKKYWLSTPDLRLDTLVKLQDMTALVGICSNCIVAFTQFYLFMINMYPHMLKASSFRLYWMVTGGVGLCMLALVLIEFNVPPEEKQQAQ